VNGAGRGLKVEGFACGSWFSVREFLCQVAEGRPITVPLLEAEILGLKLGSLFKGS